MFILTPRRRVGNIEHHSTFVIFFRCHLTPAKMVLHRTPISICHPCRSSSGTSSTCYALIPISGSHHSLLSSHLPSSLNSRTRHFSTHPRPHSLNKTERPTQPQGSSTRRLILSTMSLRLFGKFLASRGPSIFAFLTAFILYSFLPAGVEAAFSWKGKPTCEAWKDAGDINEFNECIRSSQNTGKMWGIGVGAVFGFVLLCLAIYYLWIFARYRRL
jgi:hypothetical protein